MLDKIANQTDSVAKEGGQIGAESQPTAGSRPGLPFILAYAADLHGCGWHRIISPSQTLTKAGLAYIRASHIMVPVNEVVAAAPSVIVFQRQVEVGQIEYMRELRQKLPNTKFIYELDDHLSAVDEANYHETFLAPPDEMDGRIAAALELCDQATCPTEPLAEWLRGLSDTKVIVLPNLLPELDEKLPELIAKPPKAKLRVGWAGGISHDGDLEQLIPAVRNLAESHSDKFQFVFLGMRPKNLDEKLYEFHEGVPPHEFGRKLVSANLDLSLAPIIDSTFNRGKSNLRLIQAGMAGAAVIASHVGPYLDCPAIFSYADSPEEWEREILRFAELKNTEILEAKKNQRRWAKNFGMRGRVKEVAKAWLIPEVKGGSQTLSKDYLVSGVDLEVLGIRNPRLRQGPEDHQAAYHQARENGLGLILSRPLTYISDKCIQKLIAAAAEKQIGSVCLPSNDGGTGVSLISTNQFFQITPEVGDEIGAALATLPKQAVPLPFPVGPICAISARAVQAVVGWPEGCGMLEGLAEWGTVAGMGGLAHLLLSDCWATASFPEANVNQTTINAKGMPFQALAQVLQSPQMGAWRMAAELAHMRVNHRLPKVPGNLITQLGPWSAYYGGVPSGGSPEPLSLARVQMGDQAGLEAAIAAGIRWLRFEVGDCLVGDDALAWMEAEGEAGGCDLIYSDWLVMPDEAGGEEQKQPQPPIPCLLPANFDFHYGLGRDFISAACIFRSEALAGKEVPKNRNEIWAEAMRIGRESPHRTKHLPNLMVIGKENKEVEGRIQLIQQNWPIYEAKKVGEFGWLKVNRRLASNQKIPTVSVIIPTIGDRWILRPCLATLAKNTGYPGTIEMILVVSGSEAEREKAKNEIAKLPEAQDAKIIEVDGQFSFPVACNKGAQAATGSYLAFINDDVRFPEKGWLTDMVALAQESGVGWVGIRLVKQDGSVQCAGIYAGRGAAFECFKGIPNNDVGFGGYAHLLHQTGAACAACAVIDRDIFKEIGGFREEFPWNYNDVMAGVEARRKGFVNLLSTNHDVMHIESASRSKAKQSEQIKRLVLDGKRLRERLEEEDSSWPENLEAAHNFRGLGAVGSRYDGLRWDDEAQREPNARSVLAVGLNIAAIAKLVKDGKRVFVAQVQGGSLKFANPALSCLPNGVPVERAEAIRGILQNLTISEIHLVPVEGEETVLPDQAGLWLHGEKPQTEALLEAA